ncbi:hypothetical protein SISSUDRAFT_572241 [Sistotremastrum suecicum HHB10207 ss-3]|uniref:Uncharacterized protein n=1 Tax=Sistotremastrum suecicum HHB10207 ss-3 TaxID=1314776 RepID=A0A166ERT9_9AGAM|nr:hypothetical protein SISSUDRAFT_572241 [Sistotremastrum suecicum HHB10207 ss-3]
MLTHQAKKDTPLSDILGQYLWVFRDGCLDEPDYIDVEEDLGGIVIQLRDPWGPITLENLTGKIKYDEMRCNIRGFKEYIDTSIKTGRRKSYWKIILQHTGEPHHLISPEEINGNEHELYVCKQVDGSGTPYINLVLGGKQSRRSLELLGKRFSHPVRKPSLSSRETKNLKKERVKCGDEEPGWENTYGKSSDWGSSADDEAFGRSSSSESDSDESSARSARTPAYTDEDCDLSSTGTTADPKPMSSQVYRKSTGGKPPKWALAHTPSVTHASAISTQRSGARGVQASASAVPKSGARPNPKSSTGGIVTIQARGTAERHRQNTVRRTVPLKASNQGTKIVKNAPSIPSSSTANSMSNTAGAKRKREAVEGISVSGSTKKVAVMRDRQAKRTRVD